MAKKQYDKARDCAVRGIKLHPTNIVMYTILSDIELRAGKRDKAIAVYEQGVKATKRHPELLSAMANLLIDAKRLDGSEEDRRRVADRRAIFPDKLPSS